MAQSKSKPQKQAETEIMLVTALNVENIVKNPNLLYEALALSPFVVLIDGDYHLLVRSEEVAYVSLSKSESPYITIVFRNGRAEDIGD